MDCILELNYHQVVIISTIVGLVVHYVQKLCVLIYNANDIVIMLNDVVVGGIFLMKHAYA